MKNRRWLRFKAPTAERCVTKVQARGGGMGGLRVFVKSTITYYSFWTGKETKTERTTEFTNWHNRHRDFEYCEAKEPDYVRVSNKSYGYELLYHTNCTKHPHHPGLTTEWIEVIADKWFKINNIECEGEWRNGS